MIDFRYHVVSIVAIFLALTVGLVIGASILSKGVADSLRSDLSQRNDQIKSQQNQINELKTQIDQQDKYITDTANQLVSGRLSGLCVALVEIAGANSDAYSSVRSMAQKQSGATICSETMINASLSSASASSATVQSLSALVAEHAPRGQKLTGTPAQQAVELIGEALTTYQTPGATAATANPTATASASAKATSTATAPAGSGATSSTGGTMTAGEALGTLDDFQSAGFITLVTQPVPGEQASLAYVQAPTAANADGDNQTYITLAESLRKDGAGTVVGGSADSSDKGGLVYAIINDDTATREISTVDNTDVTMGQVASVFCLEAESQADNGAAGHYGTGANNDGPLPPIATGTG
ncbi:copper transporter [Actinospica sp.]|uniref:copper transporter n=1 Tax=Actinospica sp. TaxID=1872142 RepID=UPI002B5E9312|nr:copper transporter [Actinospica sp.]HWG27808.1 copper transporter [Actinospica sp.]